MRSVKQSTMLVRIAPQGDSLSSLRPHLAGRLRAPRQNAPLHPPDRVLELRRPARAGRGARPCQERTLAAGDHPRRTRGTGRLRHHGHSRTACRAPRSPGGAIAPVSLRTRVAPINRMTSSRRRCGDRASQQPDPSLITEGSGRLDLAGPTIALARARTREPARPAALSPTWQPKERRRCFPSRSGMPPRTIRLSRATLAARRAHAGGNSRLGRFDRRPPRWIMVISDNRPRVVS